MSATDLLHQARRRLETLTPERLKVADDFLAYLADRESDEATAELLALPGFLDGLREAEQEVAAGRFTPVEELRRRN